MKHLLPSFSGITRFRSATICFNSTIRCTTAYSPTHHQPTTLHTCFPQLLHLHLRKSYQHGGSSSPSYTSKFYSTHAPMNPAAVPTRNKVTINALRKLYLSNTPISMVTAHDFPSAAAADFAGIDMVLVGDSLAMVVMGLEDTNQVTLDDILHHSRMVARGAKSSFKVADLPMGSYEISPEHALKSAIRTIQEGRMEAVKLEGGAEMAETIKRITSIGISVLGHIGLTPQRQHSLGGFRVQGKTAESANKILDDALALQDAGCFAIVLEAVPPPMAETITKVLNIPTIGIGAGAGCSGQVLVNVDMLGNYPKGRFIPKFVKTYDNQFERAKKALEQYKDDIRSRLFPGPEHTYSVSEDEVEAFRRAVESRKIGRAN